MEVTKSTFNETLSQIKETIDNATFLCIDCELTGLRTANDINSFDIQKHYYEKVRKSCKEFLAIQFGLCAFRYDENKNIFKQRTYNFYIFPSFANKYVPDQCFLSQVSSIEFLVSQGFDFNKLFKEGIPYLNSAQELKYRDALAEAQRVRANNLNSPQEDTKRAVPVPVSDKPFIDDIIKRLEKFIESDDSELMLPKCNAFLRMLIYQTARTKFHKAIYIRAQMLDNKDKILVACKITSEEFMINEEKKRVRDENDELDNCIGFSKVIKHVVESDKLIVGHNMCLDLLHTVDKFLAPLPADYNEFKDCMHCMFSKVLDTKYMSHAKPFADLIASSVLMNLLQSVSKEPFKLPKIEIEENGCGYDLGDAKEHEAGYDAYMTGLCFLSMWGYLGHGAKLSDEETFRDFKLLKPYINRLFLMRLQDAPYIHLGGIDPTPARDHVFYLTFPKDWKTNDIQQLFSPFGNVIISFINDHSAYVGLYNRLQVAVALSTLSQSDTYKIMTYAKRQAMLDGLNTFTVSPLPVARRRLSDGLNTSSKSRRTSSSGEGSYPRRSIDTIVECPELDGARMATRRATNSEIVPVVRSNRKRTISKTFEEDDAWD